MEDTSELITAVQTLNTPDAFRPRIGVEQWRMLTPFLTRHEVRSGETLLKQGDGDRTMYFLERGSLQVYVTRPAVPTAAPQKIAILRAGAVVGEGGLFSEGGRMANVEAMSPCVVWALRGPRLEELAARLPNIAFEIVRAAAAVMSVRMRANMEKNIAMS
jgi:CRP/FNR family transcriptional regulator, cyclic AMP receptor protein